MATIAAEAINDVRVEHGEVNPAPVRKSKFTEFWEKYPNGTTIVYDRRAVMK
ncbi:hypothetical protein AGMMS49982_23880 [Bacteroidia bacterium]|nr:hypothetical protein AGMMS49982_23880 [Bacteroidia bacterium]